MIELHGQEAENEAGRRADGCKARGDQTGCEAWLRVEASIREILGPNPSGRQN